MCLRMATVVQGVSEDATAGVHKFGETAAKGDTLLPATNVDDCVAESKFDNLDWRNDWCQARARMWLQRRMQWQVHYLHAGAR